MILMTEGAIRELFTRRKPFAPQVEGPEARAHPEPLTINKKEFLPAHKMLLTEWFQAVCPQIDIEKFSSVADLQALLEKISTKLDLDVQDSASPEDLYSQILTKSYVEGQAVLLDNLVFPTNSQLETKRKESTLETCQRIVHTTSFFPGRADDPLDFIAQPNKSLQRSAPALILAQQQLGEPPKLICQGRTSIATALIERELDSETTLSCSLPGHIAFLILTEDKAYLADPTEKDPENQIKPIGEISPNEIKTAINDDGYYSFELNLGEKVRVLPNTIGLIKSLLVLQGSLFSQQANKETFGSPKYKNRLIASYLTERLALLLDSKDSSTKVRCQDKENVVRSLVGSPPSTY